MSGQGSGATDLDLVEYLLVCAPRPADLGALAASVVELVESRTIRLIDVVVLHRRPGQVEVTTTGGSDVPELASYADHRIRLSHHDVELAAVTLAPGTSALLLLLEDRWAGTLASAARGVGGRVVAGERITRERLRAGRDLIGRSPTLGHPLATDSAPPVDPAQQIGDLASLVSRGVLSLDQYELQRRRVLGG
ncbi:hypothetical protein ABLE68_00130 [Nocardioides sp. CN2-186]|uniref:hypothetical protein n=1 Tax=Nocardioides tweenelious TaxID=3156607 RepID=UPI0032B37DFA